MWGDVLLVLAVIGFWAVVGVIAMLLIRNAAKTRDNEEEVCDLTPDYYPEETPEKTATT
jgi:hypothetical protein